MEIEFLGRQRAREGRIDVAHDEHTIRREFSKQRLDRHLTGVDELQKRLTTLAQPHACGDPVNPDVTYPARGADGEITRQRNEAFAENLLGAYVAKDNANLLVAVFNGQPVRCGNGVIVEQVLRLRNVSIASGNISAF